jgi:hypothetical protein
LHRGFHTMRLSSRIPAVSLLALLALLALGGSAAATQVVPMSADDLARDASLVVRGQVTGVRSYWNDAHTRILTEAAVTVSSPYKGAAPASVRVVQMGGVVDNVRMTVAGSLEWTAGEDVLLFLQPSLPGRWRVAGFTQGKYTIERDPAGVEYAVSAGIAGTGTAAEKAAAAPARLPLDRFLAQVGPALSEGGR